MDFEFTQEEKAFQKEIREFLEKEVNDGVVAETESMQGIGPNGKELLIKMGEKRLLAPSWPETYGGRGMSHITQGIMFDEMGYYQGPWPLDALVIGPTLTRFGTEEQKEKYLPDMASGKVEFALGYTEPEAGSDLASIRLRGLEDGDHYILNGQKVFNTESHYSDYHWLLVRTDTDVPKHKGLSMFIVDLKSPGITIRPLYTSAGLRTNEVFYEDVRVPRENLVGEKNKGWVYAGSALGFERIMWTGDLQQCFDKIVKFVRDEKVPENRREERSWILDELADLNIRLHIARMVGYKAASMLDHGQAVPYESSLSKLYVTETRRKLFTVGMEILGHYGELCEGSKWAVLNGMMQREYLDTSRWTIVAGTSEIQRLVIATRGLGLPRK
jgi:hypothetical protein